MNAWTDDFIAQCLCCIPDRSYRRRLEQELRDHLEELAANFEEQGLSPEEAHALALEQLGSPTQLAKQYRDAWKKRLSSPRYRLSRAFYQINLVCYCAFMAFLGALYLVNTKNFGSAAVGLYGLAALALSILLLVILLICSPGDKWSLLQIGSFAFAAMQIPPIVCWLSLGGNGFTMSGFHLSDDLGLLVHIVSLLWSIGNGGWAKELRPVFAPDLLPHPAE